MPSIQARIRPLVRPALAGMVALSATAGPVGSAGCAKKSPPPAPARVDVPPRDWEPPMRERDPIKPLPQQGDPTGGLPPPPFDDAPLVSQRTPEQRAFVEAYESVGRPRIMVFVSGAAATGGRDEIDVGDIDYETAENILADWFASDGQVEMVSPTERERISRLEAQNLQSDRPQRNRAGGADVIVRVRAQQTRQSRSGDVIRLVAEAVNTDDGRQIGRSVVDVPPPLDKLQLNRYTRFVARRLMDQMTTTWRAMSSGRGPAPAPGTGRGEDLRDLREIPPGAGNAPTPDATMQDVSPAPSRRAPTTRPSTAPDPREPAPPPDQT